MTDSYNRVGRSLTSYTLDQLSESPPRLSRSRFHGLRSAHSVQVPHVDTPNPIRRAATLEGRTQIICITPSSTRESWLKRAQSPSASSSPSNLTETTANRFPNSHSDGALMKRLLVSTEPRTSIQSRSPYRTRISRQMYTSYTTGQGGNCSVPRSVSNELQNREITGEWSISPTSKVSNQPYSTKIESQSHSPTTSLTQHISRPMIPNIRRHPDGREVSCTPKLTHSEAPRVRLSKSIQFEPVTREIKPEEDHINSSVETEKSVVHTASKPTKTNSSPRMTKSKRKPRLLFTTTALKEMYFAPFIKPNGKVCEYPLHSWLATAEPPVYGDNKSQSFPHPFPPETSDGLDQFVGEESKTCPTQYKWPIDSAPDLDVHAKSQSHRLNLLLEAADVLISKQQEQQRHYSHRRQHHHHQQQQPSSLQYPIPLAPLAQSECDQDLTNTRISSSDICQDTATATAMQRASAETESSLSERFGAPATTKQSTQVSTGREKPKFFDSRRTTPRQLKQHQHKQGGTEAKVSNSLTNVSEKSKTVTPTDTATKSHPGEIASSLIRTASSHIRSTWSKLKRSNSGHSAKSQVSSSTSVRERRCSDPSRGLSFENDKINLDNLSNHQQQQHYQHSGQETSPVKTSITSVPPRISSLKDAPPRTSSPSTTPQRRHRTPSAPGDSPPLQPGCSKWSTRLDPPPPVSNGRPIAHAQGPVVFKHIQRNRSTDLSPSDGDKSKPVVHAISRVEWKPTGRGLGTAAFSSLPTGYSDDLNSLADDCVDVGELGQINIHTGSFTGRYPHSRSGQLVRFPPFTSPTGSTGAQTHHRQAQPSNNTPNRLSPSRPLYLSPPYPGQSSGNTTRSAPSPSLSSVTSTSGPGGPEPVVSKGKSMACSRLTSKSQLAPATGTPQTNFVSTSSVHGSTNVTSFVELDPVLTRLLSDASSLDEYRSALRPQAVKSQTRSLKPFRTSPTSPDSESTGNQLQVTSAAMCSSSLGSSDPGSMALSQESSPKTAFSSARKLSEDHYNLRQEINDLIQLEFSYSGQRGSPARTGIGNQNQTTETENRATPRLSEPNVSADIVMKFNGGGFGPRSRQHPFRWSSGAHTSTPKSSHKLDDERALPGRFQAKMATQSTVSSSTLALDAGSVDRITWAGKRARIRPDPATDVSADSQLNGGAFWGGDTDAGERTPIWFLTAGQLALLRKLGLVQLTSLAEKYCVNRSPFNWRFLKYRTGVSPADGSSTITPSQASHAPVDIQVSEPVHRLTKENSIDQADASTLCAVASQAAMSQTEMNSSSHTPRWTGYDGPVFGQSLASWQRRLGYPLPFAIVHMMDHLERIGATAHGIFRRPGGKVRTQALREQIERDLSWKNFDDWQPYDVADLLKQFFRELPECLLTSKLSTVLVNVYSCIPASSQLDLLRWVLIGLPDENRVVLQKLLYLLHSLVRYAHITQMSASNLAVCFAPSLFRLISANFANQTNVGLSPRRLRRTTSGPDPKDLADQRTAQLSLSAMITHAPTLFEISTNLLRRARLIPNPFEPRDLESIIPAGDWPTWIQNEIGRVCRECSNTRSKGWSLPNREAWKTYQSGSGAGESLDGLEIHYKKPTNPSDTKSGPPLRTWRCSLPIPELDPKEIIDRFWYQRTSWDPEVGNIQVVDQISDCVDVCTITYSSTFPQPLCEVHALRGRQCMLDDGAATMFCESISQASMMACSMPSSCNVPQSTTSDSISNAIGHIYEEHVYVRPLADKSGCRVYLLSRVDLKGHSPDWYVNHWGHTLVRRLINLRRSFQT